MRSVIICLLFCLAPFAASPANAELTPGQFAYGLPLSISGEQPFYELELPLAVYQTSQRDDLGDIRVFNAAGQIVPHALRSPSNQTRRQNVVTTELPFFPLSRQTQTADDDLSLHVERTAEGTIVDVQANGRKNPQSNAATSSYLIDAGALKRKIDTLELLWAVDATAFLSEVVIETSKDLVNWEPLTTAAVGRLVYQDFRLDQNKIVLPRSNRRYLRLTWPIAQPVAELTKVRVLTEQSYVVERPAQRRLLLASEAVGERRYRVDLKGALPVAAVTTVLPDNNSLAAVSLFSSNKAKGPMQKRWQGLAYTLTANGSTLSNGVVTMTPIRQRYWELFISESEASLSAAPQLEFIWQPDRLVFLAQGEGPYTVAYGNGTVAPSSFQIDALLRRTTATTQQSMQPQQVQPGEAFVLGGNDVASHQPRPWKQYILWGVLSLGVLLIGGMSYSLYRKLHDTEQR